VLSVSNRLLEILLQVLNFLIFVLILNASVSHLLLLLEDLIVDRLLVFFPLLFQGF